MPETCRDIYDNKPQLLHQVGTSRHFHIWCTVTLTSNCLFFGNLIFWFWFWMFLLGWNKTSCVNGRWNSQRVSQYPSFISTCQADGICNSIQPPSLHVYGFEE